jgi:hypothetical protein
LTDKQIKKLKKQERKAEKLWTGKFDINGKRYFVLTNVIFKEPTDVYNDAAQNSITSKSNVIENVGKDLSLFKDAPDHQGIGVIYGKDLIVAAMSYLKFDSDTFAHEIGHLLGLEDRGHGDKTIMGYDRPRNPPTGSDLETIIERSGIQMGIQGTQHITGHK